MEVGMGWDGGWDGPDKEKWASNGKTRHGKRNWKCRACRMSTTEPRKHVCEAEVRRPRGDLGRPKRDLQK